MLRMVINSIIEMIYLFAYGIVAGPRAFVIWLAIAGLVGSLLSVALSTVPIYTVMLVVMAAAVLRPWNILRRRLRKPARSSYEIGLALGSRRGR